MKSRSGIVALCDADRACDGACSFLADLDTEIRAARAGGRGMRELWAGIARRMGLPRREVYRRALALETK